MNKQNIVGIADMKLARYEGTLITYALGSCVGICLYDPFVKLGALIHIMLPAVESMDPTNVFKYGDTGITETLRKLQAFGALKGRLVCKIAGGAKMFDMGDNNLGNIGQRNVISVKEVLRSNGIRIQGEDTGANYARTVEFDVSTGKMKIRTFGRAEITL